MRRINPCWSGWACDRENPSSGDQDQAQVQAIYSSDMPVSEPVWWGIPCEFSIWVFQFWIEGISTTGYRIVELWLVWLMFCEEALTPSDIYTHVWSLLRGNPLQIFILHFPCWNWKKILMTWSIRLGYQACPSPIPKWYAHVWTHKKGESLAIFYFAFCNLELRGFWQEDSQEVAVGPVDVPRGDVTTVAVA